MNDHHTLAPEADEEVRSRLRAFANDVKQRVDTEVALGRMPRRSRPPTSRLMAIAACLLAAVALVAALEPVLETVDTIDPSNPTPSTTACTSTTRPQAITSGGQMNNKLAAPVASAATALMLLGACGDDGPRTLAKGEDVELVGSSGLGGQTLNISVEENDGMVTGEFRISEIVTRVDCADTHPDGIVILGGEVTAGDDGESSLVGVLHALIIREGDPDSVALVANDVGAGSCIELLESIPEDLLTDESQFVDLEAGEDIETG